MKKQMSKPLILITNDDGIDSLGLRAAIQAALPLGEVLVCAPYVQQTAAGRAFTLTPDLGILEKRDILLDDKSTIEGYSAHGSPAFCSLFGIFDLAHRKPDLVISGVNYGYNLGISITHSGTLGASLQAASHGVPTLATSLETSVDEVFGVSNIPGLEEAEIATRNIAKLILSHTYYHEDVKLPEGLRPEYLSFLNMNIPKDVKDPLDYKVTFIDNQNYYEISGVGNRDITKPYHFNVEIKIDYEKLHPGSDIHTLEVEKRVSVTPISLDLTRKDNDFF